MAIPPLNENGLLPEGIHDSTLQDVCERFGSFQRTDRRPVLWNQFELYFKELQGKGIAVAVLLNGSFVTAKPNPNDIDFILVLRSTHDYTKELSPSDYNTVSAKRVKKRYGLDLLVAREGSDQYVRYLRLFQQVRLEANQKKGIIRIEL